MTKKHASVCLQKKSARALITHVTRRCLSLSHLSSGHKTAHDANEDAVNPPTLCPREHEAEHAGRRGDECVGEREDAAAQESLQLKRRNLELPVVGCHRQWVAQALSAEAEYNMHEPAHREQDLAKLVEVELVEVELVD
jgi:hypothetical protein